tara:strand:- start:1223 stop:1378 length:156 start_codon:yes stop_codon:yes gene_type:complete
MFIKISWKNSKGEPKENLVESNKVQSFINAFIERDVVPSLIMPDNVVEIVN